MSEELTSDRINQLADDSIYVIEKIKAGELTDGGGDLERNAQYLQNLLDMEDASSKLSSADKSKITKAIQKAK